MDTVAGRAYDPTNLDDRFTRGVHELVAATAPRLFAVVEEFRTEAGDPDAEVAAWGLAHADGTAQVNATRGNLHPVHPLPGQRGDADRPGPAHGRLRGLAEAVVAATKPCSGAPRPCW